MIVETDQRITLRGFFSALYASAPRARRLVPLRANGGPAVAVYNRPLTPGAPFALVGITLFALRGGRITQITRFASPELLTRIGLPAQPPAR